MDQTKRECILVEAARAFTRHGFRKASVDGIAKKAGVAKGTVYLAVESKEDLLYQVLNREIRAWVAEVSQAIDPRKPADELLRTLTEASFRSLDARPLLQDLLFGRTAMALPAWAERLGELRRVGNAHLVEVLRLGMKQGRFRTELDVEEVATLLNDLQLSGYVLGGGACKATDPHTVRRMAAALDLVLNGLRPQPKRA